MDPTNRAERRAALKREQASDYAAYIVKRHELKEKARQTAIQRLSQNGITPEDLEKEYKRGWDAATREIAGFQLKMFYGGFALAMKREFGFGRERTARALRAAEQIMIEELTTVDMVERVLKETGMDMRFNGDEGDELF